MWLIPFQTYSRIKYNTLFQSLNILHNLETQQPLKAKFFWNY